jgi:GT2 family glycosyltransferase
MSSTLKVIIVNFNAGEALCACVESVLVSPVPLSVVVADNASQDGSMPALRERFGEDGRLELVFNPVNLGYSSAVNRLAREAREATLLFLNPDCIVEPGAIELLATALEHDAQAGIAGPWVTDSSGRVQKGTWRRFPDPWRSLMTFSGLHRLSKHAPALAGVDNRDHDRPDVVTQVEAVSGACMMVRRSAAEVIGYFDENYAMHCEDLDLMYRLHARGFHCLLVPAARVIHLSGVSSASRPWWVHRQKHLGMQRYFRKTLAQNYLPPFRWLVYAGIWCHYALTLPVVFAKQIVRS